MKTSKSKTHWIIDTVLFAGFVFAFLLDLTGLSLHQWLGIGLGVLAFHHLVGHWNWVVVITDRLFKHTSGQARRCYIIDVGLLLGFYLILLTGLAISTWVVLPLSPPEYIGLKNIHVAVSIITLLLVIVKVGLHWRWIITTANRHILTREKSTGRRRSRRLVSARVSADRRDFLKLMSLVSAAAVVATGSALDGIYWPSDEEPVDNIDIVKAPQQNIDIPKTVPTSAQVLQLPTAPPQVLSQPTLIQTDTPTEIPPLSTPTQVESPPPTLILESPSSPSCVVRCNRRCSYPGRCRRYVDANQNGLCDLGECM